MPPCTTNFGNRALGDLERVDPYVEAPHLAICNLRPGRFQEFCQIVGLAVGVERGLVAIALVEQPLLRVGRILRDVELQAAGFTLETTPRVLLGKRSKILAGTRRHFEFDNDCDHG
jgi:hypothetical protein